MFAPKLTLTLTHRTEADSYAPDINEATITILSLIFEFKLASAVHIARFLGEREVSRYLYTKLRRLWQGGLLESLELNAGTRLGMPRYYMLSKEGLKVLAQHFHWDKLRLKTYPSVASLISSSLFPHEAGIVELASMEAQNMCRGLKITFLGEMNSLAREVRSDKRIEVLTPDYTVDFTVGNHTERVFTEFERTNKATTLMFRKIERYVLHFGPGEEKNKTLRIIFENERMERAFWLTVILDRPQLLQRLRVMTTNLSLVGSPEQFLEPIYSTERNVDLKRDGRVFADLTERWKLFSFL
jgi:Replication-relaxation